LGSQKKKTHASRNTPQGVVALTSEGKKLKENPKKWDKGEGGETVDHKKGSTFYLPRGGASSVWNKKKETFSNRKKGNPPSSRKKKFRKSMGGGGGRGKGEPGPLPI